MKHEIAKYEIEKITFSGFVAQEVEAAAADFAAAAFHILLPILPFASPICRTCFSILS